MFECMDTGLGMSPEFLDKLFLPFERVQDSTHSKATGTGLGMAITKNIVDMMSGNIQVKSELGKRLHLYRDPAAAAAERSSGGDSWRMARHPLSDYG